MNEIQKLKKEWQELDNDAKHICQSLKYLRSRGEENSDLYKNLFMEVSKLSDEREVINFKIEKLRDERDRQLGQL